MLNELSAIFFWLWILGLIAYSSFKWFRKTPAQRAGFEEPLPPPAEEELSEAIELKHQDVRAWPKQPEMRQLSKAFPRKAMGERYHVCATLVCIVRDDGRLACKVEDAASDLVGQRAVWVSTCFRAPSEDLDRSQSMGKRVKLPIRFSQANAPAQT